MVSTAYSYPGVYVEEVPSSVRSIIGVGTSITAFVGRALKGPVNKAILIHSFADYTRIFGGLWQKSSMSYAVYQYFQNGGVDAVIVRSTKNASAATFSLSYTTPAVVTSILTALAAVNVAYNGNNSATKSSTVASVVALVKTAGLVVVEELIEENVDETFNDAVLSAVQTGVKTAITAAVETAVVDAEAKVTANAAANAVKDAAKTVIKASFVVIDEEISQEINLALVDAINAKITNTNKTVEAEHRAKVETAVVAAVKELITASKKAGFTLEAADPGVWGEKLEVVLSDADKNKKDDDQDQTYFNIAVHQKTAEGKRGALLEMFRNVSLNKEKPRYIRKLLVDGVSTYMRMNDTSVDLSALDFTGKLRYTLDADVASDGDELDNGAVIGVEDAKTGMYALKDADLFNLLCIPVFSETKTDERSKIYSDALAFCESRRAMLLVDPPADDTNSWDSSREVLEKIGEYVDRHKNGAIFFPRIVAPDPLEEYRLREFDPCGAVAGVISRTDAQRGVWKAPAGIDAVLSGVPDLSVRLTDKENGELNPKGINCLRIFPDVGRVIWGSRTLRGADSLADQWKYLSVRRTALYIEETLFRGTQWVVFEPNDELLWSQIRLNIGSFMRSLFTKGAFQGTDPKQAYLVKCDSETTTQTDINAGIVNIIVGFAPLKPAEFVIIKIQQLAGQEIE